MVCQSRIAIKRLQSFLPYGFSQEITDEHNNMGTFLNAGFDSCYSKIASAMTIETSQAEIG